MALHVVPRILGEYDDSSSMCSRASFRDIGEKDTCGCLAAQSALDLPPIAVPRRRSLFQRDSQSQPAGPGDVNRPPYYWHAPQYRNDTFEREYPVSDGLLELPLADDWQRDNWQRLLPLMRKLEAGANVTVLVLGGSMTVGHACKQIGPNGEKFTEADCAHPRRFLSWLQKRYPKSTIHMEDRAQCGATTTVHASFFGMTLLQLRRDVDLIIFDTVLNGGDGRALEQMIRATHELVPNAVPLGIVTLHNVKHSESKYEATSDRHRDIFRHYHLPMLDFGKIVESEPAAWKYTIGKGTGYFHPMWETHQLVADVLASTWGQTWDASKLRPVDNNASYFPAVYFKSNNKFDFCLEPLVHYSALSCSKGGQSCPSQGGWKLYEDRPGKPGWIGEADNSVIQFPLRFGAVPKLNINYLRSYEGMGTANLLYQDLKRNKTMEFGMAGKWSSKTSQTVALSWDRILMGLGLENKEVVFGLRLTDGPKFKVTDVFSC